MDRYGYPFAAIVGQGKLKEALLLNSINPRIGGVLIAGEKGTSKSTAVRGFAWMLGKRLTEIPLSVSEDRLVGSVELEETMRSGRLALQKGLLAEAHHGFMYVDEVNLLPDFIVDILLQVSAERKNRMEREGLSCVQECEFVLIGTMNQEEGELRPQFLDRFGLFVEVKACKEPEERVVIMKRLLDYDSDPKAFQEKWAEENQACRRRIAEAKALLPSVILTEENRRKIVDLCLEANTEGNRAEIVLAETARAVAAWKGQSYVTENEIREAALFALPHRCRQTAPPQDSSEQVEEERQEEQPPEEAQKDSPKPPPEKDSGQGMPENEPGETKARPSDGTEQTKAFSVGSPFQVMPFSHKKDKKKRSGPGKRTVVRTDSKSGRYLYAALEQDKGDLALDATIRAAAPHQLFRDKSGVAIRIQKEDIREKVRQKKTANLIVFVVDASGSMGAGQRMVETKGAVLSLLQDAYVKRDKVALVAFRGNQANVLLPPTRSVERGCRLLETMETGGKTPLNAGLYKGLDVVESELRRRPDILPLLVIITDGKGNLPVSEGKKPAQELLEIGEKIRKIPVIETMVVDIEKSGYMYFGYAKKLADSLGGKYFRLDQLKREALTELVEQARR